MNFKAFLDTLPVMGRGMLGIFVVMGVVYALILLLGLIKSNNDRGNR